MESEWYEKGHSTFDTKSVVNFRIFHEHFCVRCKNFCKFCNAFSIQCFMKLKSGLKTLKFVKVKALVEQSPVFRVI